MKKTTLFMLAAFAFTASVYAQPGGGFQRKTPEERAASIHAKLDSAFKLDAAILANVDTAMTALYKAQDKKREEMMSGGTMPDRETMMAEMKKFSDAKDEILKAVLKEEQYKTWKELIEPAMRTPRPSGGGGPGGPGAGGNN